MRIFLFLFLFFSFGCYAQHSLVHNIYVTYGNGYTDTIRSKSKFPFKSDTSINKTIYLHNEKCIKTLFGDTKPLVIDTPIDIYVLVLSTDNKEYLKMYINHGGSYNYFDHFEVGYRSSLPPKLPRHLILKADSLYTESGIHLGMNVAEIIKIMGVAIKQPKQSKKLTLDYEDYCEETGYYFESTFTFKEGTLVHYSFGFPEP